MISSPKPPDPYEQAAAQTGANISSAIVNSDLNNLTEITPTGRIDYIQVGEKEHVDAQGNSYTLPIKERHVTLSEGQQEILDGTEEASKGLLDIANERIGYMGEYLPGGVNTDNITEWKSAPEAPTLKNEPLNFASMELFGGSGQDVLYGYAGSDTELDRVEQPGNLISHVPLNTDFSGISVNGGGGVGRVSGDIEGVGQGIQGSVDLNTTGGSIGSLKRDFNAERLSGDIADAGPIRTEVGYDGPGIRYETTMERFDTPLDGVGEVRRSIGIDDFSADRARVEDAWMDRWNRLNTENTEALHTRLRAEGIDPLSEMGQRRLDILQRQHNDQINQAILLGGQEQSRQFGMERDSALFENQSQQQEHTQSLDRGRFGLDVNAQNNATALAADRFFNESVGMGFQQALEEATFGNASQGQVFAQNLQQALLSMDAAERNANIEQMRAQLHNDTQRQFFEQTLANAGFGNQAELDMGDFVNRSQQQRFGQHAEQTAQRIAAGSVNNQAADIANRHAVAAARLELDAQNAANDALLSQAGFYNDSITQGVTNSIDATRFNNEALQGEIDNASAAADFYSASCSAAGP